MPALLGAARITLIVSVVLHIVSAVQLTQLRAAARPLAYARQTPIASTYSSRTMFYGGLILALFIIYHLMHFTFGNAHPNFAHDDVYANVINGFRQVPVSAMYIVAMLALGLHMRHGVWSVFQTLGLNGPKTDSTFRKVATGLTAIVVVGNISVPVAVLAGVLQ
jgi:succinate dehydrogenase / fumarate reductase cytochrome b subunit